MPPRISVAIPTHNRWDYLEKALAGLAQQSLPSALFEIVVVDNGSTDGTKATVDAATRRMPNVRYVYESNLGLNIARNTAWKEALAPYIAFLDDDAIPNQDWIERMLAAFEQASPRPGCVGGRIEPIFDGPVPAWLKGSLLDYLSVIDHSPQPKFLTNLAVTQKLAGANFGLSRDALERIGGFVPDLDRIGTKLLSGGDVLVQIQVEQLGLAVYYDPAIHVRHHVSARRLTREWIVDRAYWGGASDALTSYYARGRGIVWAARTMFWGLRHVAPFRLAHAFTPNDTADIHKKCESWHRLGFVAGGAEALRRELLERKV
jgi:glycosyltransferase involved in cell wall biosynthesis